VTKHCQCHAAAAATKQDQEPHRTARSIEIVAMTTSTSAAASSISTCRCKTQWYEASPAVPSSSTNPASPTRMLRVCVWLNAKKRKQWLPTVFPHTAYRCHSCQCGTHHHHSRPHQSQRESNIPDGQQQHQLECSAADRDADADGSTDRYVNVEILPIETVEEFEQKTYVRVHSTFFFSR